MKRTGINRRRLVQCGYFNRVSQMVGLYSVRNPCVSRTAQLNKNSARLVFSIT